MKDDETDIVDEPRSNESCWVGGETGDAQYNEEKVVNPIQWHELGAGLHAEALPEKAKDCPEEQ